MSERFARVLKDENVKYEKLINICFYLKLITIDLEKTHTKMNGRERNEAGRERNEDKETRRVRQEEL